MSIRTKEHDTPLDYATADMPNHVHVACAFVNASRATRNAKLARKDQAKASREMYRLAQRLEQAKLAVDLTSQAVRTAEKTAEERWSTLREAVGIELAAQFRESLFDSLP